MNVFISYSHSNKNKADIIEEGLSRFGLNIIRDERELSLNKNLKEFMQKIKETDYAILLIGDAFLKSQNCMFEVLELLQASDYKKRLIPIITDDAKIYSAGDISDYLEYWDSKKENVR